jgi:hypothetical protein
VSDIDFVKYHEELAINVVAPGAITQGLLPLLRKKQTRKIIFISSVMGSGQIASSIIGNVLKGVPIPVTEDFLRMSSYCSSKSALTMQAIVSDIHNLKVILTDQNLLRVGMEHCSRRDLLLFPFTRVGKLATIWFPKSTSTWRFCKHGQKIEC